MPAPRAASSASRTASAVAWVSLASVPSLATRARIDDLAVGAEGLDLGALDPARLERAPERAPTSTGFVV